MIVRRLGPARALGGLILVVTLPATAAAAQPAPSPAPFSKFGYGETDVRGHAGRSDFFFALQPGTKVAGDASIDLAVSHSPLLRPTSTLTVLAGDVSVGSVALTPDNVSGAHVAVRVPADLIARNGLALSVRTFLRLTDDQCEDPDNPALWTTVHASSTVQLATQPAERRLDDVASLIGGGSAAATAIRLPAVPDPDMLRAAGVVAVQVGRWQGRQGGDPFVTLARSDDATGSLPEVVLATTTQTPAGFPAAPASDHGVLALSQQDPPRLLVGGTSAAAMAEAAEALPSTSGGPVAVGTGDRVAPVVAEASPWQDGAASFAQLGIDRQEVDGPGAREVSLRITRPPQWTIKGDPRLDLVVESAATLDPQRSSIQVQLDGFDLGSRRLDATAGPHSYRFDIPAGIIDRQLDGRPVRSLDLTVRFLLEANQAQCQPFNAEGARAVLLPTSAFRLPHNEFAGRELGRFPSPVVTSRTRRAVIVLPITPDANALAAGLQVAAGIGRWSDPTAPAPLLITADRFDRSEDASSGLVLLGEADAQIGHPIDIGRSSTPPGAGQASAVVGVVPSPFAGDASALVVHGDGAGILLASRTLTSRDGLGRLRGSRAVLIGDASALTLADRSGASPPPELAPVVGGQSFVKRNQWVIPAAVLLAGFLVAVVLVARYRWSSKRRRAKAGAAAGP